MVIIGGNLYQTAKNYRSVPNEIICRQKRLNVCIEVMENVVE